MSSSRVTHAQMDCFFCLYPPAKRPTLHIRRLCLSLQRFRSRHIVPHIFFLSCYHMLVSEYVPLSVTHRSQNKKNRVNVSPRTFSHTHRNIASLTKQGGRERTRKKWRCRKCITSVQEVQKQKLINHIHHRKLLPECISQLTNTC